jgi:hypothetical protein
MVAPVSKRKRRTSSSITALASLLAIAIVRPAAADITVTVVDDTGAPISNGFRWLLEEDNTMVIRKTDRSGPWAGPALPGAPSLPGTPSPNADWVPGGANPTHTLSVNLHKSHAPTVCVGDTQPANAVSTAPANPVVGPPVVVISAANCPGYSSGKNYILSVLPWHTSAAGVPASAQAGYGMTGRLVAAGQKEVTAVVHNFAHPTAQITAIVFEDNQSINAAYDQPSEHGLSDFTLVLTDPAGPLKQDAFAYPLGTTYKYKCSTADGRPARCDLGCKTNPDGSVTCGDDAALNPGEQPEFALDPASHLPLVDFLGSGGLFTCPGPRGSSGTEGYTAYQRANCVDPYTLTPLAIGEAVVRYLPMNKYAIEPVVPVKGVSCGATSPSNDCSDMLLTGTLEGTRQNDAWVRAGEPRFNITLGQLNWLVFYGFVHPMNKLGSLSGPKTGSISGQVVQAHDQHPPYSPGLSPGLPVPNAYIGLNNLSGNDEQVYTAAADPVTGQFSISGIPPGTYELVLWDKPINEIIDYRSITLGTGPGQSMTADLGPVAIYGWFGKLKGHVFSDPGGNGFPSGGVPVNTSQNAGIPNVPINLRFTDGSMAQSTTTASDGSFSFDQYSPFWRFLVTEVDTLLGRPTGLTTIVDNGGTLPANPLGAFGINPQLQPGGASFRTEPGGIITEALNLYADMTAYIAFGKAAFDFSKGENGGIRGMINYATTRTEEDPKTSKIDGWEPGIPNVTVTLHKAKRDCTDPQASPVNDCWLIDDASDKRFPLTTQSDSWNDEPPDGCVGDPGGGPDLWPKPERVNGFTLPACAETFKSWDQNRPGVFDGAYAFTQMPDGSPIPSGNYIVQVTPPPGYQVIRWGDRNIEFGDPKIPSLAKLPDCVGAPYDVPEFHTLFPDQMVGTDTAALGVDWKAGLKQPLCDKKVVGLNPGATAPVDFHLFTFVPKSARIWGAVWNDLMLEFDPNSPNAGGNLGVSYLPVSIKDWKGTEVARFYTDQWGHFDGLVPANYDIAPPIPLGLVLNLLTVAPNDPGPILDTRPGSPTAGQWITDPWFNPAYNQEVIRENWEFYAGRTTFVDTIVIPVAAFVGNRVPLNCAYTDKTPELRQVDKVVVSPNDTITITSMGMVEVPNPAYDPTNPKSPLKVIWDHGFGDGRTGSRVTVGGVDLKINAWASDGGSISATIPDGADAGQLLVTRGDTGRTTTVGVTLHAQSSTTVLMVSPPANNCTGIACAAIQPAIDSAPNGTVILLAPGTYQENVNLWKPVTLQGFGAAVTRIDLVTANGNLALKNKAFTQIQNLLGNDSISIVTGQTSDFTLEQGSGILVVGCDYTTPGGCPNGNSFQGQTAQIDGLTITGADEAGGGILVNGFTDGFRITNDEIVNNQGSIGGGIRFGESLVPSSVNPLPVIDHNRIAQNGSRFSGGGGIALYGGTDGYLITNNLICGNMSNEYGGGIGHFGLSDGGIIRGNVIVSNESVDEGGGIHIGGENAPADGLSAGAGSVLIDRNLIQGNKAGDDGGGIRLRKVNGTDVANASDDPSKWWQIDIFNNIVVNNSSADHGGGLSFDDTVKLNVVNNTVARNDSTSTGSDAFGGPCAENDPIGQRCPSHEAIGGLVTSVPQAAGIVSFTHSTLLYDALTQSGSYCEGNPGDPVCATYSNPILVANIVWQNRSFFWDATANQNLGGLVLADAASASGPALPGGYWDFAVYGTTATLSPTNSLLTNGIGATSSSTNLVGLSPAFLGGCGAPYAPPQAANNVGACFNVYQGTSKGSGLGNYVTATFTPNGIQGDYHISGAFSAARRLGGAIVFELQDTDYDGDGRLAPIDAGADQTSGSSSTPHSGLGCSCHM